MSDTPRTDDFEKWWKVWGNHVSKVFVYARNLECEIYETQEELAEAKKDAERYRYVRSIWGLPDEKFNDAIDAAMKEGGK